ncbi:MAG: SusC/RagA family TonB-linked outer membrane protein, partial [Bacteroidota bacterium]
MLKQLLIKGLSVFVAALLSVGFVSEVQAQEVTGTVTTAEDGQPLPGVNIRIQGTDSGTVSDMDGEFSLDVPSLNSTLVFSYVGFESEEIALNGRSSVDVEMTALALEGDELIVTAFGIEREARSLSYSTQNVDTETLAAARESNVMASFAGRIGGMSVTQSGSGVGAPTRVILRGNRSISGSSQPLYIVDGVPVRGNPQDISPDDVESVEVLKGPNAAALYGSAAQNGAIVITTTRGEAGVVNVSLSNNFTMSQANILRDFQNEYGQGSGGQYNRGSEFSWGPRMDGQQVDHWTIDPNHPNFGQTYALEAQPDNVSDVFRIGYNNASNLTASVGGEKTQTVFSYTYTTAQGIFPGNDLERNNVNLRITSQLSDRLTLDTRLTYMRQIIDNQLAQGGGFANPTRNTYRLPRNIRTEDVAQFEFTDNTGANRQHYWAPGSNGGNNPYWVLNRNLAEHGVDRTMSLASLDYEISDNLNFMVRGSLDRRGTTSELKRYNDSYVIADNGYFDQNHGWALEFNTDFLLAYEQDLTDQWSVNANLGGNIQQQRNESISVSTSSNPGMTIPNFFAISNTQTPQASHNIGSPRDIRSLYAFGQIGWRDAIYLDITGRNDWSSTLPEDNNSYFYPSVGLTTILSDLIEMPEAVSLARLRLSYAQVGSSASPFQLQRFASISAGGNQGFLSLSGTLPNTDLKPEKTESYEIGADIRFFQGRLGLDVTAYQTNTTNQLFTVALPIGSGASSFFTNGGNIENKGIEFSLNTTPVERMDLVWDVDFTFGLNRNE